MSRGSPARRGQVRIRAACVAAWLLVAVAAHAGAVRAATLESSRALDQLRGPGAPSAARLDDQGCDG
jgi:hypothetical protein